MDGENGKLLAGTMDDTPTRRPFPVNVFVPIKDSTQQYIDGAIIAGPDTPDAKGDHSKDEVDAPKVGNSLRSSGHHNNENDINAPNMRTKKGFFGKKN